MELHSQEECRSESCFWVEFYFNGVKQNFDPKMCMRSDECTWYELNHYILDVRNFIKTSTNYKSECDLVPPFRMEATTSYCKGFCPLQKQVPLPNPPSQANKMHATTDEL
jgi:hypothetical protein